MRLHRKWAACERSQTRQQTRTSSLPACRFNISTPELSSRSVSTSSSKQKVKADCKKQEAYGKTQDARSKKQSSSSRGSGVWHYFVYELCHKFKAITKKRWCPTSFPPRQRNRHRSGTQNEPIGWPSLPRHTDADYKEKNEHNRNVRCSANQNQSVNTRKIEPWPHCSGKKA